MGNVAQCQCFLTFLLLTGCVFLLCFLRSLITTLHQPPSLPLWWDSQWRPLSPTITPRSPLEPPRSPACRSVCVTTRRLLSEFSHGKHVVNTMYLCPCCFPQLLQQLPAERVEQKEIPAEHMVLKSTFDSLVQRCQLAAGDPVSPTVFVMKLVLIEDKKKFGYKISTNIYFSANKKETWWCSQTFGIPVWQAEGAVGKILWHDAHKVIAKDNRKRLCFRHVLKCLGENTANILSQWYLKWGPGNPRVCWTLPGGSWKAFRFFSFPTLY